MENLVRPQEIVIISEPNLIEIKRKLNAVEGKVDINTFVVRCDSVRNSPSGMMFTAHFRLIPN